MRSRFPGVRGVTLAGVWAAKSEAAPSGVHWAGECCSDGTAHLCSQHLEEFSDVESRRHPMVCGVWGSVPYGMGIPYHLRTRWNKAEGALVCVKENGLFWNLALLTKTWNRGEEIATVRQATWTKLCFDTGCCLKVACLVLCFFYFFQLMVCSLDQCFTALFS